MPRWHHGQFEKFIVKVNTNVKFEICVNSVKTCSNIFLIRHGCRKYIILPRPTSSVSITSNKHKAQRLEFYVYIEMNMVSNYLSCNSLSQKDYIRCFITMVTQQNSLSPIDIENSMYFALLPWK